MAVTTDLMTVAKLADAMGVPKAKLQKSLKEAAVQPDRVKGGCSYFSRARVESMRGKLQV